jgi:putative Mg2+ transporter-C (MgtC) family protein
MNTALPQLAQPVSFNWLEQVVVTNGAGIRLLVACTLGGMIGLVRELNRKSAGVRTNLLISMGAAFFTQLGVILAGDNSANKAQVASNIVQGIGFLGAGLIIHNRSRVNGLASAASIWVVASIGMACGAGLYVPATLGACIVIVALAVVGFLEQRASLKAYAVTYEVRGHDTSLMLQSVLAAMDQVHERLTDIQTDVIGESKRASFLLATTRRQHERLLLELNGRPDIGKLLTFREQEDD